jgi:hypothetical protein
VHQREIMSHLEHDGHHVAAEKAAALLALLLDTQALHETDRDRIERELSKSPERSVPVQPAAAVNSRTLSRPSASVPGGSGPNFSCGC